MHAFEQDGYRFTLVDRLGSERGLWESRLRAAGLHVPVADSASWARTMDQRSWFLGMTDSTGRCRGGAAIRAERSRAVPGFLALRVERFGSSVDRGHRASFLSALATLARERGRVLRLHVELFDSDPVSLGALGAAAASAGFTRSAYPRCYDVTSLVDLSADAESILASFHGTARRHIRAVAKHPVALGELTDPALAPRMNALLARTLQRTGGLFEPHQWERILRYSAEYPGRSRVVGLWRTDRTGPERLLAYAWGCFHGDHAHYSTAASDRDPELKLPLAYGIAWELMQWARSLGARYFDFGGLTAGSHGEADPLGGISDFKRYFNGAPARVGEEWIVEPNPVAAGLSRLARRLRGA